MLSEVTATRLTPLSSSNCQGLSSHELCSCDLWSDSQSYGPPLADVALNEVAVHAAYPRATRLPHGAQLAREQAWPPVLYPPPLRALFSDPQVSRSACLMTTQLICKLLRSREAAAAVDVRAWPPILDTGWFSNLPKRFVCSSTFPLSQRC